MPDNLEIKLRAVDPGRLERIAKTIGKAIFFGQQIDTYFQVPSGRLKLRETSNGAELIYYRRPDKASARRSEYLKLEVGEPRNVKSFFKEHLGIKQIVRKRRRVYLYKKARIHLDEVVGLGSFFEIEIPIGGKMAQAQSLMRFLLRKFELQSGRPIRGSYADLLLSSRK